MQDSKRANFPTGLSILGGVGALAVGFGAANVFGGVEVMPLALRFENYGPALMAIGAVLIVPELVHFLRRTPLRDDDTAEL